MRALLILTFTAFSVQPILANAIDKGFDALGVFDYFKAKEIFYKQQRTKKFPISSFGLATIYSRTDNPFSQLDSAYVHINRARNGFDAMKPGQQLRYAKHVDDDKIDSLRQEISTLFFIKATAVGTIEGYQTFMEMHPWANEVKRATYLRDSLLFVNLQYVNTSNAYQGFLEKYPTSEWYAKVYDEFQLTQFQEVTAGGMAVDYATFIEQFPTNKYVDMAEDRLYELSTADNSILTLNGFILTYPENRNIEAAWERLYQLSVYDYTKENIQTFINSYPNYPNVEKIQMDLAFIGFEMLPFKKNGKYGFMDIDGMQRIAPVYSSVAPFKEGLAVVSKNGKFGYINKNGDVVVDLIYSGANDFEQGRAIVERFERVGMIDRTGVPIFETVFEDLGVISEGLIYGMKDSLYGYYNTSGTQMINELYTEAFSFQNGMAKVEINGKQAFINTIGKYVVHPAFEEVEFFNDSLIIFGKGDKYGLMKKNLQIVVPNKYDAIGKLSEGLAIVSLDGDLGYINGLGEEVIAPQFDEIPNYMLRSAFKNGVAVVSKRGQYGMINTKGKEVIPFKNEDIGDWSELIAVKRKNKWGYINRANVLVIPATYEYASSFVGNLGQIQEFSLNGVVNKQGQKVIETGYNNAEVFANDYIIVNNGALYGLFNSRGASIAPMIYSNIVKYNDTILMLVATSSIRYFDTESGDLIELKEGNNE